MQKLRRRPMTDAHTEAVTIRSYSPGDEQDWLRCRALGFLPTAYFDDVLTKKATYEGAAEELVADSAGAVSTCVHSAAPKCR